MSISTETIGFFNPIYPNGQTQTNEKLGWLGRVVEPYFDFEHESFGIVERPNFDYFVAIEPIRNSSWASTAGRICIFALMMISYMTLVVPLMMLMGKLVYRAVNQFIVQKPAVQEQIDACREIAAKSDQLETVKPQAGMIPQLQKDINMLTDVLQRSSATLTNEDLVAFSAAIKVITAFRDKLKALFMPKGIVNLGATCFMNASIQALIANDEFKRRIKEGNFPVYQTIKEDMARQLRDVLRKGKPLLGTRTEAVVDHIFKAWEGLPLELLESHAGKMNEAPIFNMFNTLIKEKNETEEAKLIDTLKKSFPKEVGFLFLEHKLSWEQRKQVFNAFAMNLKEFARTKSVMGTFTEFLTKYEELNTRPENLRDLAVKLRKKLFDANLLEQGKNGQGLYWQHDAAPIFEFVLRAIGISIPLKERRLAELGTEKYDVEKIQPSGMIQLPMSGGSFQDLIDRYAEEGISDGACTKGDKEPWVITDDSGKELFRADEWKQKEGISGEPPVFVQIQLKRFINEFKDGKYIETKISAPASFGSTEVDLANMFDLPDGEQALYRVKSAVIQHGSLRGGHYYAVVEKGGTWFKCNDSSVTLLENPLNELANGYIFILERADYTSTTILHSNTPSALLISP